MRNGPFSVSFGSDGGVRCAAVYAGLGLGFLIAFVAKLPETKGRTLEDIERDLTGGARSRRAPKSRLSPG